MGLPYLRSITKRSLCHIRLRAIVPRQRLYNKSAPKNAGGGRMDVNLMRRANERSVVAEVDHFIGAVGAGTLIQSEATREMPSFL